VSASVAERYVEKVRQIREYEAQRPVWSAERFRASVDDDGGLTIEVGKFDVASSYASLSAAEALELLDWLTKTYGTPS